MSLSIGIVGNGVVGSACAFGFRKNGHSVLVYDVDEKKRDCEFDDLKGTDLIYICVPTPRNDDGSCDTTIVRSVIDELIKIEYSDHVVIKSTVSPGTTQSLIDELGHYEYKRASGIGYKDYLVGTFKSLSNNIEFLRQNSSYTDMVELHNILVVGSYDKQAYDLIVECHGDFPKKSTMMTPTEAELVKVYHNSFAALRVVFANELYELATKLDCNYLNIKRAFLAAGNLPDRYFDISETCRAYESPCLSKDPDGLLALADKIGVNMPVLRNFIESNELYRKTPFAGLEFFGKD